MVQNIRGFHQRVTRTPEIQLSHMGRYLDWLNAALAYSTLPPPLFLKNPSPWLQFITYMPMEKHRHQKFRVHASGPMLALPVVWATAGHNRGLAYPTFGAIRRTICLFSNTRTTFR